MRRETEVCRGSKEPEELKEMRYSYIFAPSYSAAETFVQNMTFLISRV